MSLRYLNLVLQFEQFTLNIDTSARSLIFIMTQLQTFLKDNLHTCSVSDRFSVCIALTYILTQELVSPAHTFGSEDLSHSLLSVFSHPRAGEIKPQPTWIEERPALVL